MLQIKTFDFDTYNNLRLVANGFWESKAFPEGIKNIEQMIMIMQAGVELGIGLTQSLSGLMIVNGIVTAYGTVAAMLMKRAGYNRSVKESTAQRCEIKIWRGNDKENAETVDYVLDEAVQALLTKKDNRTKYPKDMLYWKCLARARKRVCPDALGGMPIYEDYVDIEKKEFTVEEENKVLENFTQLKKDDVVYTEQPLICDSKQAENIS